MSKKQPVHNTHSTDPELSLNSLLRSSISETSAIWAVSLWLAHLWRTALFSSVTCELRRPVCPIPRLSAHTSVSSWEWTVSSLHAGRLPTVCLATPYKLRSGDRSQELHCPNVQLCYPGVQFYPHISPFLVLSLSSMGILLCLTVLVILLLNVFCATYCVASASSIDLNRYPKRGRILSHEVA